MDTPPTTLDRAALDRLVEWGGDKLLRQMLRLFLDNSRVRLESMQQSLAEAGDLDELHRGAHSLKSSAANVGAMEVSALAGRLEAAAEARDLAASGPLYRDLVTALDTADGALRRVLEEMDS